ncbi:MAG: hypothetical protein M1836_006689 [Candelina mexicana]|nr:MAG: hypothetical protein M1836_006689 [Candelina mexicana]
MLNSNIDISQAVITTFKAYVSSRGSTWLSGLIESATIYGQLGKQPRDVLREPNGVLTLAFTVVLKEGGGALARYGVVNELRNWLEQDGNSAVIKRVANAARVGSGTIVKKGEDGKRDGSEGASQNMLKTNFCLAGGEERSWTFVGGEVDALTEERVYCWSAISRGNLLLRYGGDLGTL